MVLATVLQYSQLKKRSLKKVKASDGIQTRAFQIFIKCDHTTISTTSADHINLKILLKYVFFKDNSTFIFKSLFFNLPEI